MSARMEMRRTLGALCVASASALVLAAPVAAAAAEDRPTPGLNLFSVEQDVEIGRSSAVEVERQLPILHDRDVDRYLNRIIARLADQAPGGDYRYAIKAVNAPEINAFSLPGGPMYVSRGLIQAARSEAELVGVLAHEMSHVALRHGTHQASKANLGQAGLGRLGGLLGRKGDDLSQIVEAAGGLGWNVAFLEFSRDDEYQADLLGAEMMAGAGYDPVAMADFLGLLRSEQGNDPGRLERFLSSHPPSADREARIREQARGLRVALAGNRGAFDAMRKDLRKVSDSGALAPIPDRENPASGRYDVRAPQPSSRLRRFAQRDGLFGIEHPDDRQVHAPVSGYAVSMAPAGGVVDTADGRQAMLYGVIIDRYAPFEDCDGWQGSLEDATDDLVRHLIRSHPYLRAHEGQERREEIDGERSLSVVLSGRSPVTGGHERVTAVTRGVSDGHVIYALCITPGSGCASTTAILMRMLRTLSVDESAFHRGPEIGSSFRR